jgi:cytochrome c2
MSSPKVLGAITALLIILTAGTLLILLPESGASQLIRKAFHLGWPGGLVIVGLLLYFQFGRKNDPNRNELVFKSIVGLLGYSMLFIAIANYAMNFNDESPGVPGEPRFLPVSLVMFTVASFMMAMYFTGVRVLLQIGGFMFFVAACLAGFGNWLPQVKADPPPAEAEGGKNVKEMSVQDRADLGEKIIFGAVGASGTQGAIGKGQCPLCHGFQKGFLSERAPNLFGVPKRAEERLSDPRYSKADPSKRDTIQKEACSGCGTANTAAEYIAESHACPNCYVVAGFGVKGTNDKESPMPPIHKPPINLSIDELIAVDTWLFAREGVDPPTPEEIEKAYFKFIPESERPKPAGAPGAAPGGPAPGGPVVTGDEPVNEIFTKALCFACHTIPGIPGAVGAVGPKLVEGTNAPQRLKDPAYKGKATTTREYIMESILTPSMYVVKPYPDNIMPKDFGKKLNAAAINKIINYLSQLEEGKAPPKIE